MQSFLELRTPSRYTLLLLKMQLPRAPQCYISNPVVNLICPDSLTCCMTKTYFKIKTIKQQIVFTLKFTTCNYAWIFTLPVSYVFIIELVLVYCVKVSWCLIWLKVVMSKHGKNMKHIFSLRCHFYVFSLFGLISFAQNIGWFRLFMQKNMY